ncbi:MAG: regulatory protein RecX, partial [Bdellovibrionales bacterium]|nr:regulatory protein RecX [Bdellovibrionales bacterium]
MQRSTELSSNLALAMDKVVRMLARRDHSELEIKQKLNLRFDGNVIDKAIDIARRNRWIGCEKELAERVAKDLSRKKKGQYYIEKALRRKGLPLVEWNEQEEVEKAQQLVCRRFADLDKLDLETKQRVYRFLANRGFKE